MAQTIKHLSTMWETQVQSLGREDPLEKEMATHSSTLAWRMPWTEPGRPQSMCGAAGAGRRPGPGFPFPLKRWDSPPPSGNLEPANQHAPSKKKGTYQGKAEKPRNAQV